MIIQLLLRLSEHGSDAVLTGTDARSHYGPGFDHLLSRGVLRHEAKLADWPVCTSCECGQLSRQLDAEGETYRARCPLDHSQDAVLGAEATKAYGLNLEALARLMSQAAGLGGEAELAAAGVWSLGFLPSRRRIAACFERRVIEQPTLPILLGALARPRMTLLGPAASPKALIALDSVGLEYIEHSEAWSNDPSGRLTLNTALVEPAGSARLAVDLSKRRVFVDGTPQHVPGQPFVLLEMLVCAAARGHRCVANFEIEERTSGRSAFDLARDLRNALAKGRSNRTEIRGWIVGVRGTGRHEITLPPEEIELRR